MPTYDYRCDRCGVFSAMRSIADRDLDSVCPDCGTRAARTISMPSLSLMSGTARSGHQINERAAHAPKRSGEYRHVHGPGCGCSSTRSSASAKPSSGAGSALKGDPSGRPWMISH